MNVTCDSCKVGMKRVEKIQTGAGHTTTIHQCPTCHHRVKIARCVHYTGSWRGKMRQIHSTKEGS